MTPSPGAGPRIEVHDADDIGGRAAALVAEALRGAVDRAGRATFAVSGGSTPTPMFAALARADVPWDAVHVLQVDERVAPDGDDDRNLTELRRVLLDHVPLPAANVHPMPVGGGSAEDAADGYAATLRAVAGERPLLDVVHLGLGDDGHTASLVPGDPVLSVRDETVAATGPYQGRRRVTLTVPVLRDASLQVWLVVGHGKAAALRQLRGRDHTIPATHVVTDRAVLLLDPAAAA